MVVIQVCFCTVSATIGATAYAYDNLLFFFHQLDCTRMKMYNYCMYFGAKYRENSNYIVQIVMALASLLSLNLNIT